MPECIDWFQSKLQIRSRAIKKVADMFEAVQVKSLISATEELKVSISKLTTLYNDASLSELLIEIPSLGKHIKAAKTDLKEAEDWATLDVLTFIAE